MEKLIGCRKDFYVIETRCIHTAFVTLLIGPTPRRPKVIEGPANLQRAKPELRDVVSVGGFEAKERTTGAKKTLQVFHAVFEGSGSVNRIDIDDEVETFWAKVLLIWLFLWVKLLISDEGEILQVALSFLEPGIADIGKDILDVICKVGIL